MLCRYTFRLDPNAAQDTALRGQLLMLGELWNALLQRREDVYRRERRTLSKHEQYKEITELRAECPEWAVLSVAAARGVADRLDNVFRRAKAGAGAQLGHPRYKPADRWTSISFTECSGSSWRVWQDKPGKDGWRVYVKGVSGEIKAYGLLPAAPTSWRTGTIVWRDGAWWLSVVIEMEPRRKPVGM
jgi:putative transposase